MRGRILVGCALSMFLLANSAWAGSDSGLYLGGSLGSSDFDIKASGGSFDDTDTAYKVFAGYNFGLVPLVDVAVEASYVDFGAAEGNGGETKVKGVDAFGLVGLSLGIFSVFGKVGAIHWDADVSGGSDDSGTDPGYGLGVQVQLLSIAIRGEYELFTLDDADIGMLSAGVSFTF